LITTQKWIVNFTQLYPCDSNGAPKYSFKSGETVWIYAEWKNYDTLLTRPYLACIAIYDSNSVPIGIYPTSGMVPPGQIQASFFQATSISSSTPLGNTTLYGTLFTDYPTSGGYPYCPERVATFTITSSQTASPTRTSGSVLVLSSDGDYNFSFKLPSGGLRFGIYNVSVSTYYYDMFVTNHVTFRLLGLQGDINGDGKVNVLDAILMSNAFNSVPGSPNWNPRADLNNSGRVDVIDAIILANHWGQTG
jgi:hypothetical protein